MISATLARELLIYDPDTGEFRHRITYGGQKAGDLAGAKCSFGYWNLSLLGYRFKAHRVAWLYVHGSWPEGHIDHIDCDRSNNRIQNLRLANNSQNKANSSGYKNNTSGFKGVSYYKPLAAWRAAYSVDGKKKHIGYFSSPEEAHAAYMIAASEQYGEFARSS